MMTTSFLTNSSNDLYIATDGNLATASGLLSVVQNVQNETQAILGECVFDIERGLPDFETIWIGVPNVAQYETALRDTILRVSGVRDIISLAVSLADGVAGYTAEILTDYGTGAMNG